MHSLSHSGLLPSQQAHTFALGRPLALDLSSCMRRQRVRDLRLSTSLLPASNCPRFYSHPPTTVYSVLSLAQSRAICSVIRGFIPTIAFNLGVHEPRTFANVLEVVSSCPAIDSTCALQYVMGEKEPQAHSTNGTLPTSFPFSVFVREEVGNSYLASSWVLIRFNL